MRAAAVSMLVVATLAWAEPPRRELRVCADPNNLPVSNRAEQGFENVLAELVAKALDADLRYTWVPGRRGVLRKALQADRCDVVMGVPAGDDLVPTTRPYYRSSYVLVLGPNAPRLRSLDAPELEVLSIGVPLISQDGGYPPTVMALAGRNLMGNVRGFPFTGSFTDTPHSKLVHAVGAGEVDVALLWGPLAGYLAHRWLPALEVVPLSPAEAPPGLRFAVEISIGVSAQRPELRAELERVLESHRREIGILLDAYGVPRLPLVEEAVSLR